MWRTTKKLRKPPTRSMFCADANEDLEELEDEDKFTEVLSKEGKKQKKCQGRALKTNLYNTHQELFLLIPRNEIPLQACKRNSYT